MKEAQYRIWRRRILTAIHQFGEAAVAAANGNDDVAEKMQKNAEGFLRGAKEMERFETSGWILALIRPLGMEDVQPIFIGDDDQLVKDPASAIRFRSFDEACAARTEPQHVTGRFPEPLGYHLELYKNMQEI